MYLAVDAGTKDVLAIGVTTDYASGLGDPVKTNHGSMQVFLEAGFILREDIVKYQWRTKTAREKWGGLTKVADEYWVDGGSFTLT